MENQLENRHYRSILEARIVERIMGLNDVQFTCMEGLVSNLHDHRRRVAARQDSLGETVVLAAQFMQRELTHMVEILQTPGADGDVAGDRVLTPAHNIAIAAQHLCEMMVMHVDFADHPYFKQPRPISEA